VTELETGLECEQPQLPHQPFIQPQQSQA
jgi:hypothetical protein